jgi:hypothetical protein
MIRAICWSCVRLFYVMLAWKTPGPFVRTAESLDSIKKKTGTMVKVDIVLEGATIVLPYMHEYN